MIRLDAATVLLQWATGGLLFLWVTTRRREVGIGYGWLLRSVFLVLAAGAVAAGRVVGDPIAVRDVASVGVVVATGVALAVSIARRRAGVAGERARREQRARRVAGMVGAGVAASSSPDPGDESQAPDATLPEFPPALDLVAPVFGTLGLVAAGVA